MGAVVTALSGDCDRDRDSCCSASVISCSWEPSLVGLDNDAAVEWDHLFLEAQGGDLLLGTWDEGPQYG